MWHVYDVNGNIVEPRVVGGKSQIELAEDIARALRKHKFVIFESAPGSGKSLIALYACYLLNAKKIIINSGPYRALQVQYANDYGGGKFIIGEEPYRFGIIWGRQNHKCIIKPSLTCQECECLLSRGLGKRGELCIYYNPPTTSKYRINGEVVASWTSVSSEGDGHTWHLYARDGHICPYFKQFKAYAECNVIVLNSWMWLIETLNERKVKADVEIIDEFDIVFQQYHPKFSISIDELKLLKDIIEESTTGSIKFELLGKIRRLRYYLKKIVKKDDWAWWFSELSSIVSTLQPLLVDNVDDPDIANLLNIARKIQHVVNNFDSYEIIQKFSENRIVIINAEPRRWFRKLLQLSASRIILMSATPLPENLLRSFYGINDYEWIIGEKKLPGKIYLGGTFSTYISGKLLKIGKKDHIDEFVKELIETIDLARIDGYEPRLIIPVSEEHVKYIQQYRGIEVDCDGSKLEKFRKGEIKELATTRAFRGIDLPGDKLRSIVLTKCPFPDLSDDYWQVLKRKLGKLFDEYYHEFSKNNLLQVIARGLRETNDWIWLYSPDKYVYELLKEVEKEGKVTIIEDEEPETRKTIRPVLEKVLKGDVVSVIVENKELRERVKHTLTRYFSCTVEEIESTLIIASKAFEHKLQQYLENIKSVSDEQQYILCNVLEEFEIDGEKHFIGEWIKLPINKARELESRELVECKY